MKKITKDKIFFDEQGNLYLPKNIKLGGQVTPSLKSREWLYLVFTIADKSRLSKEQSKELFNNTFGSKSNQYKIKKSLKNKGYL